MGVTGSQGCRRNVFRRVAAPAHAGSRPAERFVRSIKEECLSRVIPLGERHFRRTLRSSSSTIIYHRERNQQGLGNDLIDGVRNPHDSSSVRRRQRIGGLLSYYYRAA
jgi:hypothetical protein